ncbi:hypothetical protein [Novosphingopyxis sp.]|uniref:hypothetical protein n=1 Tax=Novosphingopyxis sp. TaxID=2709690 RepID=UPI003B5B297F
MHAKLQLDYYLQRAEQEAIQGIRLGKTEASVVHDELSLSYSMRARELLIRPAGLESIVSDVAA